MSNSIVRRAAARALLLASALSVIACGDSGEEIIQPFASPNVTADSGLQPAPIDAGTQVSTIPDTGVSVVTPRLDSAVVAPVDSGTVSPTPDTGVAQGDSGPTGSPEGGSPEGGAPQGKGDCCPDGNCLCHGPVPTRLSGATKGPFKTATRALSTGTVYYPTDAEPPFASIALCGGFLNTGPEMVDWGSFYASYGIVTIITSTGALDFPADRANNLLASVEELKKENAKAGSPLMGKLSDRYGTSGYSMGGGGTTIASGRNASLKTSVGLASWGPETGNVKVPTLLLCGTADSVAPCGDHTDPGYAQIPAATPKMKIVINGGDHLAAWFGPQDGGGGTSGGYALAFQKVFLEGDTRWKPLLLAKPSNATQTTNIQP